MREKHSIRDKLKQQLKVIGKPRYEDDSYKIAQNLYNDQDWQKAKIVGLTVSNFPEVDTFQIIRKAWEENKQVVVPKCRQKDKALIFRRLDQFSQLEPSFFGLLEPIVDETAEVSLEEIELLIVPGLAFNRDGYRLGFGGGYYDRTLQKYTGKTISLAFEEQIVTSLPIESHDLSVMKIITPKEVIVCGRG